MRNFFREINDYAIKFGKIYFSGIYFVIQFIANYTYISIINKINLLARWQNKNDKLLIFLVNK